MVAALLAVLVLSACGQTTPAAKIKTTITTPPIVQHTSYSGAGCSKGDFGNYGTSQSMTGAISSCLRVGAVSSGLYSIVMNQIPISKGPAVAARGLKGPTGSTVGPPVNLSLSPSSGKPGTKVVVTGILSSPLSREITHGNLCWDSCRRGLQYSGVNLKWMNPTTFETTMVVPGAPWISADPVKISPLISGDYPISIQCLGVLKGCGLGGSEGSASFHLSVPKGSTPWCRTLPNCAFLSTSPGVAFPGDVIKVTGYAPLLSVIGSDHPFVFQLNVNPGAPKGREVKIETKANAKGSIKGSITDLYFGHAQLKVQPPPTFASLGKLNPTALVPGGLSQISSDPTNPGQVDWCSQGTINLVGPGGTKTISTAPVGALLKQLGFGLTGTPGSPANCMAVASNGAGVTPNVVAAAFSVAPQKYAPPVAEVALLTKNGGATWQPVPVPKGASMDGFGGFRYQGGSLEVLFRRDYSAPMALSTYANPLVEATGDGGSSWGVQNLSCPKTGPCVTFGLFTDGNCAGAIGSNQALIYSTDNGQSWIQPSWPQIVRTCSQSQLAALPNGQELFVESESQYLLRLSSNGGKTWTDVSVPLLQGMQPGYGFGRGGANLLMLPEGSLLVTGQHGSSHNWELLQSRATKWCRVAGLPRGVQRSAIYGSVYVIGSKLWWLTASNNPAPSVNQLNISDLHC